ncbi:outer membrane beta-barrel protein [uncultured Croceitalea sp.]|uniref:outer membrane beta-barrel protein n=1 Tax=uncultured Croceitalea sp. TaxID=1798908 RepID=UPI0033060119
MKRILIVFLSIILNAGLYGQIEFEPGYFINSDDQRIECLIKNNDWKDNPQSFIYMLTPDGEKKEVSVKHAKEFGVTGKSVFVAALVNIDRSSNILRLMSFKREPDNKKEYLFLRRLVDGEVDLYNFEAGNLVRFFYSTGESKIQQLVYKNYINQRNQVAENNQYKQQLYNDFGANNGSLEELAYKKADMIKYFIAINEERGITLGKNIAQRNRKGVFHFSLMGGFTSRNLSFERRNTTFTPVDFGTNLNVTFGAELEFVFPFNKNKWAVVLEPSFNNYKAETTIRSDGTFDDGNADFNSLEVVFGVRHYMFLNDSFRLFVNGFGNYLVIPSTQVDLGPNRPNENIGSTIGPALGLGLDFAEKIGLELRYQHIGNVVISNRLRPASTLGFGGFSMILNYQLF